MVTVQEYFEEEHYNALEASLLEYGKEKLGCVGITPVWLSYYVGRPPLCHSSLSIFKLSAPTIQRDCAYMPSSHIALCCQYLELCLQLSSCVTAYMLDIRCLPGAQYLAGRGMRACAIEAQ